MSDSFYLVLILGPILHAIFITLNALFKFDKHNVWKIFTCLHGLSTLSVAFVMIASLLNKQELTQRGAQFLLESPLFRSGTVLLEINRFSSILAFFINLIFFLNQFLIIRRREFSKSEVSAWSALSISLAGVLFGGSISLYIFFMSLMLISLVTIFGSDVFEEKEKYLKYLVGKGLLSILLLIVVDLVSKGDYLIHFPKFLGDSFESKEKIHLFGILLSFWLISGLPPFHLDLSLGLKAKNYERNLANIAPAIFSIVLITFHLPKETVLFEEMRVFILGLFIGILFFSVFDLMRRNKINEYEFRGVYAWMLSWVMLGLFSGNSKGISGGLVLALVVPIIYSLNIAVGLLTSNNSQQVDNIESDFSYISDIAFILSRAATLFAPVSIGCLSLFMIITAIKNEGSSWALYLVIAVLSLSILATAKNFLINSEYSSEYSLSQRLRSIQANHMIFLLPLITSLLLSIMLPSVFLNAGFEGYLLFFR
ncbi:MAG: hypothetical protein M9962_02120 [Oligoflexia bacterium]|nr:hypothetical protein [Oligoflexia bacterium]